MIINLEKYSTPKRPRKITVDSAVSDHRYKYSTVESRLSKDSKTHKESVHWANHQKRRDNRASSLFKTRKAKLQEITGQNKRIFIRINQQQSHYPVPTLQEKDKNIVVNKGTESKLMGPISHWSPPDCFIVGNKGIMCDRNLACEYSSLKPEKTRLPSLGKIGTPDRAIEKQNHWEQLSTKQLASLHFTPNRQRNLSDLYMLS